MVMEVLLTSPRALVSLTLNNIHYSKFEYDLPQLQRILDVHSATLQKLTLGTYSTRDPGIPYFSQFTSLRLLGISMSNLVSEDPFRAARKLTTPKLAHIVSPLDTAGANRLPWFDPDVHQYHWMKNFASCRSVFSPPLALEKDNTSSPGDCSLLQNLKSLKFEYWNYTRMYLDDIPWPWLYMKQTDEAFRKAGLPLKYNVLYS